jgi:Na+/pantothenate symporter
MAVRFLIVFALTNTLAVGAFSAFVGGGAAGVALGVVLALLALAGFVVTARVVVPARPARRRADEARRLRRQLKENL